MKKNILFLRLCILMTLYSAGILGQSTKVGNWIAYIGNQKINSRWNFHNEIQYRNYNFIGEINQFLVRTGIGYNPSKNENLLLGYAFVQSHPYNPLPENNISTDEHRIFQQYINRARIKKMYVVNRIRFEERFFTNDFRTRGRYLFSLSNPIHKKEITRNTYYWSLYNEVFINTRSNYFDRDRCFVGGGYAINNNLRIETGFLIQFFPKSNQKQIMMTFLNNLPFHKTI